MMLIDADADALCSFRSHCFFRFFPLFFFFFFFSTNPECHGDPDMSTESGLKSDGCIVFFSVFIFMFCFLVFFLCFYFRFFVLRVFLVWFSRFMPNLFPFFFSNFFFSVVVVDDDGVWYFETKE
uniref:Uncharacterized protein n=1 Tax=Lotharella globosa TaxID=91324 RepID=A0A7S3YPB8_9EUKA